ncbi:MAG TPA: hypothetical protein QGF35_08425 [Dehalococcoidia bacterium]|nr:hypothetical protein [Dehalococcoidia bacterium]
MRSFLARRSPFLWITLAPLLTVPSSALLIFLFVGEHEAAALGLPPGEECRFTGVAKKCFSYYEFWRVWILFAVPGLLNIAVFAWLLSRSPYVRAAAVVAGTLGLVRVITPMAGILISQFALVDHGELYLRVQTGIGEHPTTQLLYAVCVTGLVPWAASVGVWWYFEPLMARIRSDVKPPDTQRVVSRYSS